MKSTVVSSMALLSAQPIVAQLFSPSLKLAPRQDEAAYINEVCLPHTEDTANLPPCVSVDNIEGLCKPNGTTPLALEAHAQCMCGGSFFREWAGCQNCLRVHGVRSERDASYFSSVMASASNELCTGTPTATWADLFSSVAAAVPIPTTGNTAMSDVKSGDTAISLYYTATGSSGPGVITGSATLATATGPTMTVPATSGGAGTSVSVSGGSSSEPTPDATTVSSSGVSDSFAVPTAAVAGGVEMLVAVAGGVLVAALR